MACGEVQVHTCNCARSSTAACGDCNPGEGRRYAAIPDNPCRCAKDSCPSGQVCGPGSRCVSAPAARICADDALFCQWFGAECGTVSAQARGAYCPNDAREAACPSCAAGLVCGEVKPLRCSCDRLAGAACGACNPGELLEDGQCVCGPSSCPTGQECRDSRCQSAPPADRGDAG